MRRALILVLTGLGLWLTGCGEDSQGSQDTLGDWVFDPDVQGGVDTQAPDTAAPPADTFPVTDTLVPGDIEEGGFGASCTTNSDCLDGWCVEGPEGFICTKGCQEECPAGFDCKGVASLTDIVFLCMPRLTRLCTPCLDDLQCTGGACLLLDGRRSCASPCQGSGDCPTGWVCTEDPEAQRIGSYCVPATGSCTCNVESDGGLRTCASSNALGTCFGVESCDPLVGWGGCGALAPSPEVCDGIDNDCNGLIDDALADEGTACQVTVAGVGSCPGVRRCGGQAGWQCQGATPEPEICDFRDNDCDGQTDEDFKVNGQYATFQHCGTCNASCAQGFPGAQQTQCQAGAGLPQCVVVSCEPGYIKLNDFQCIPDIVNICQACATDANCIGQDNYCVTLSDGTFCGKGCTNNAQCPAGFACQNVGKPMNQCVPTTGVCSCGASTLGLSRPCTVTVSPSGQPSYTCAGSEVCGSGGWGACNLPGEQCDGFDNDCDGQIDEDFRDAQGRYNRVEHCGGCGISCLALSFENATPICNTNVTGAPQCGYQCTGGWRDVDGLPGCECLPTSQTTDFPDPLGIDANCDGIDGEVNNGVFVAKTGSDSASGLLDDPLRTIQAGIARAVAQGRRDVYVATGVYVESILLANGVSVYGGYSPSFRERDIDTHESAIIGADPTTALPGAVNAISVASSAAQVIRFDGFTVFGKNNPNPGGNSYAIYIRDVGQHLHVTRHLVFAGEGGPGTRGIDGTNGANGGDGVSGLSACLVSTSNGACPSGASQTARAGGGAANNASCTGVGGGAGGTSVLPNAPSAIQTATQTPGPGQFGVAGSGAGAGAGGAAGWDARIGLSNCGTCSSPTNHPTEGGPGGRGNDGAAGPVATACSSGVGGVGADGHWRAAPAGNGNSGAHGAGGGGGGAAGGVDKWTCTSCACGCAHVIGGSGGGGGAGGCRGIGGTGGAAGGGSFGIFAVWSTSVTTLPTIQGNVVYRGRGGAGGAGGNGGVAGAGGAGGAGGVSGDGIGACFPLTPCGSGGGYGGNGGNGGHGSGGAAGCGGASYGIYLSYTGSPSLAPVQSNNFAVSGAGGTGGKGGFSLGVPGPDGANGTNANRNF